ncbi:MAG: VWA domain-containing protein, partial [Thermodesulfobacteriota bacterium]
ETRNMKMALRRLRILTREGTKAELDLDKTIDKTSRNAGLLELEMAAAKKNNIKVLLFLDIGGSMDDHIELCSRLFSAAKYEFKHLEHYYFHNCLYESVWRDNKRRKQEAVPTFEMLHTYNSDYKVIIVGDASMSPYEILYPNGSIEHSNDEAGIIWLERLKEQFPDMVWLNPAPVEEWRYTESIGMLRDFMKDRMFPLTMGGLQQAIKALKDKKIKYEGH